MTASSGPRKRHDWTIVLLVAGLILGGQTIRLRFAEKAVRNGDGGSALAIRPQNGWGAALKAEALLAAGDVQGAQRVSVAALNRAPYAAVGVRTLASSLERTHGLPAAERAWEVGSSLGWRDRPTQLWAVHRALYNSEADTFAMRADAILRTAADNRAMTRVVRESLLKPSLREAMLARLARRPPWRKPFFNVDTPLRGKELEGTAIALFGLDGSGAEPSRQELADTIAGLINAGRYGDALELDRAYVRRRPDAGSLIDDGGFELTDTDYVRGVTPFDWTFGEATATLDRTNGRRSMALTTEGSRGLAAVTRYVPLEIGSYAFRYQVRGDRNAPASLGVSVVCASSGALLGRSSPAPLETSAWESRAFRFTVPAGCTLGKISFLASKSEPSVTALFDNVHISRT